MNPGTRGATPLILISLVAQVTKAAIAPTADELSADYPFIHSGDSVANYPYGWHERRVELLIVDASNDWMRTRLPMPSALLTPEDRQTPPAGEAYLAVAAVGDIDGDGKREIVCGVSLDADDACLLAYSRSSDGWTPALIGRFDGDLSFIRSISVGDVNGDGVDEIVVGGRPNGHVLLLEPATDRHTLLDHGSYGSGTTNVREVLIAQVGNRRPGILATVARQDADKWAATPGSVLLYTPHRSGWRRLVIDDFDGSTHSRMIRVGQVKGGRTPWIIANAVGVLDPTTNRIVRPSSMVMYPLTAGRIHKETIDDLPQAIKSRGFACGDVDGDGQEELVVGTRSLAIRGYGTTFLLMFKYDSGPGRWRREEIARSRTDLGFHCVGVFDVDGDGQDEVVASEDAKGLIRLYKRVGETWVTRIIARYPHRLFVTSIVGLEKE